MQHASEPQASGVSMATDRREGAMKLRVGASLAVVSALTLPALELVSACGETARVAIEAGPSDAQSADAGPARADADADAEVVAVDPCADPAGTPPRAPWPMPGACARRPGSRGLRGPAGGAIGWSSDAGSIGATSPVIAEDGAVIVGTSDGRVLAFEATGGRRWEIAAGAPISASPVLVAGGEVLYVTTAGRLGKVALADGKEGPKREGPRGPTSPLPLADGTVVYTAEDGKMHVASISDLAEVAALEVNSTEPLTLGPDGAVLAAGKDGALRRVVRGAEPQVSVWFRAGAALVSSPVVSGFGEVFVASADAKLHAVGSDGGPRWVVSLDGVASGAPAVAPDGTVYVATASGKVRGYGRDGQERFVFAPLGPAQPPIVSAAGVVLFGAEDTKLYAVLPSGRLSFAAALRARATSSGALGADGTLFLATEAGVVGVGP